jgi:hypothetical protein
MDLSYYKKNFVHSEKSHYCSFVYLTKLSDIIFKSVNENNLKYLYTNNVAFENV